jgi:transposase InsO family protein
MDLYRRRIVGWAMDQNIDTQLVLAAWGMALTHRPPAPARVFHSHRGCQYASADFRHALAQAKALPSMRRKACGYDNAARESFWSTLKQELVCRGCFKTRSEARQATFDFIETFYHRRRLHSSLQYLCPVDFERQTN